MRTFSLLLVLVSAVNVSAFSAGGHRIIAEIAWQQLDAKARAKAVELLKHHPRAEQDFVARMPDSVRKGSDDLNDHWIFLQAGVWPDLARGFAGDDRPKYHRSPWHYVNFPTYLSPDDAKQIDLSRVNRRTEYDGPFRDDPNFNIAQAIKANLAGLHDASRTKAERAIHLCWIMDLVGDSHQHYTPQRCSHLMYSPEAVVVAT